MSQTKAAKRSYRELMEKGFDEDVSLDFTDSVVTKDDLKETFATKSELQVEISQLRSEMNQGFADMRQAMFEANMQLFKDLSKKIEETAVATQKQMRLEMGILVAALSIIGLLVKVFT